MDNSVENRYCRKMSVASSPVRENKQDQRLAEKAQQNCPFGMITGGNKLKHPDSLEKLFTLQKLA